MILLKSFYRKKVTKVYIILLSLVIALVLTLQSFIQYFSRLSAELFSSYSIAIVISNQNIDKQLETYFFPQQIHSNLAFVPDKRLNTIKDPGYVVENSDGNILDSYIPDNHNNTYVMTWDEFKISGFDQNILVVSDKERDLDLNDDEIVLGIRAGSYEELKKSQYIQKILGQPVAFYYDDESLEFIIKDVYSSEEWTNFPELVISENLYQILQRSQKSFFYTISLSNVDDVQEFQEKMRSLENDNVSVVLDTYYPHGEGIYDSHLKDTISFLKIFGWLGIVFVLILMVVIIKNIFSDLRKNISLLSKLGFRKSHLSRLCIVRVASLLVLSFGIGFCISVLILWLGNILFDLSLLLPNISFMLICLSLGIISSVVLALTIQIKS